MATGLDQKAASAGEVAPAGGNEPAGFLGALTAAKATIIVAFVSLIGGVVGSLVGGYFDLSKSGLESERDRIVAQIGIAGQAELERLKNDGVINTEKFKLQRDLVVKAIEKPSPKEVRDTLKFFASSGLIPDFSEGITKYLDATPDNDLPFDTSLGNLRIDDYKKKVAVYRTLLDLIGNAESRGNYEAYFGAVANVSSPQLTAMRMNDLLEWQEEKTGSGARSSAVGKYQLLRRNIMDFMKTLAMSGNELFSAETQDILAVRLLEQRGGEGFLSGSIAKESFALGLAKQWSTLPVLKDTTGPAGQISAGQSFYGSGLDKASVNAEDMTAALTDVLAAAKSSGLTISPMPSADQAVDQSP